MIIMEPLRGGRLVNALPKAAKAIFASAEPHRSPAEWGLRWIWNHPEVTVVLSGMNDIAQVEENVKDCIGCHSRCINRERLGNLLKR